MKNSVIIIIALSILAASCTRELQMENAGSLVLSAEVEESVKSTIDGTVFKWTEDDKFGLYLDQAVSPAGNALCSVVSISGDGKKAALKTAEELSLDMTGERRIAAYYPYKSSVSPSSSVILMTVPQIQKQTDKSASHLARYDFMSSKPVSHEKGKSVALKFSHLMAKVDFLFINEHSQNLTVTDITVKSKDGEQIFGTSATLDLFADTQALNVEQETKVANLGISLSGDWTVVEPEGLLTASIMMMPANLENKDLQIVVNTREKGEFIYDKVGMDFLPQNRYKVVLSAREKVLAVSMDAITIQDYQDSAVFKLSSICGDLDINMAVDVPWLRLSTSSVVLNEGYSQFVTVSADRSGLQNGTCSGTISITSGDISKKINVTLHSNGILEIISPSEDLKVSLDSCVIHEGAGIVYFSITNLASTADCVISLYRTTYLDSENSFVYDNLGNQVKISRVGSEGKDTESQSMNFTICHGQTTHCSVETDDVVDNLASMFSNVTAVVEYQFGSKSTKYGDIILKNVPIKGRETSQMPSAIDVDMEFNYTFENLDLEFYKIVTVGTDTYMYYRVHNTSLYDYCFCIVSGSLFCYDSAGNSYSIVNDGFGFDTSNNYMTRIPSGVWCSGRFIIKDVSYRTPSIDYLAMRCERKMVISRAGWSSLNYSNSEYSVLTLHDISCGSAPAPVLQEPSTSTGGYSSLPEDVEMTVTGASVREDVLTVNYRFVNKSSFIKKIDFSTAEGMAYAIDDRGNYYTFSSRSLSCNTSWAYLAPEVPCNGSFTISGFDPDASVIRYLSQKYNVYTNYSSGYTSGHMAVEDIAVEKRTACETPIQQPTTTADKIWCGTDGLFEFTPISCRTDETKTDIVIRVKNKTNVHKYMELRSGGFIYEDTGACYKITDYTIGGLQDKKAIMIPPGFEFDICLVSSSLTTSAKNISYGNIDVYIKDIELDNSVSSTISFSNMLVEGRTGDPEQPEITTTVGSITTWDDDIEAQVLSCRMDGTDAIVRMRVKNNGKLSKYLNLYESSKSEYTIFTYAADSIGNLYNIENCWLGSDGNSECDLAPGIWCNLSFRINGVSSDTGQFEYVNVKSSGFDRKLELQDLKIEGRENVSGVLPPADTSAGTITSPSSKLDFKVLSTSVTSDNGLNVKCLVTNTTDSYVSYKPYDENAAGSFACDDQGNYYRVYLELGPWNVSNYISVLLPPNTSCQLLLKASDVSESAASLKYIAVAHNSSNSADRLVIRDLAISGRQVKNFPVSAANCESVSSGNTALDVELMGCSLGDDGYWRIRTKFTNNASSVRQIRFSYSKLVSKEGTTYNLSYPSSYHWEISSNYITLVPGIPVILEYSSKDVKTDSSSFESFTVPYTLKIGYSGYTEDSDCVINGLQIEGRTEQQ